MYWADLHYAIIIHDAHATLIGFLSYNLTPRREERCLVRPGVSNVILSDAIGKPTRPLVGAAVDRANASLGGQAPGLWSRAASFCSSYHDQFLRQHTMLVVEGIRSCAFVCPVFASSAYADIRIDQADKNRKKLHYLWTVILKYQAINYDSLLCD